MDHVTIFIRPTVATHYSLLETTFKTQTHAHAEDCPHGHSMEHTHLLIMIICAIALFFTVWSMNYIYNL